jgi:hypothetical protein
VALRRCLALLLCVFAPANTVLTGPGPGPLGFSSGNDTYGFDFTVGATSLLVTDLGLWDVNSDGFSNAHIIGLWDNSGNLLGSVPIAAGTVDPLTGEFRYAPLVIPVTLAAGSTYVLGASYLAGDTDYDVIIFTGIKPHSTPRSPPGTELLQVVVSHSQAITWALVLWSDLTPSLRYWPVACPNSGLGHFW